MKTKGNTNVLEFCIRVVVTVMFIVFNTTFNNISVISWRSVLLVVETGVPLKHHRPVANHWQTLSNNVVSGTPTIRYKRVKKHCLSHIL